MAGSEAGRVILATAYFPPVEYFALLNRADEALVEACESYTKQSYRNRCLIYAACGADSLQVPVIHASGSRCIRDIRIDYSTPWVVRHERAIFSAYNSSPFFEYYKDDIYAVMEGGFEYLFDLNMALTRLLASLFGISTPVGLTGDFVKEYPRGDYRYAIHPKHPNTILSDLGQVRPYFQVFSSKHGFIPGLSALDLLCAEGPESISFL